MYFFLCMFSMIISKSYCFFGCFFYIRTLSLDHFLIFNHYIVYFTIEYVFHQLWSWNFLQKSFSILQLEVLNFSGTFSKT